MKAFMALFEGCVGLLGLIMCGVILAILITVATH